MIGKRCRERRSGRPIFARDDATVAHPFGHEPGDVCLTAPETYADFDVLGDMPAGQAAADLDGDGVPEHIATFRNVTPTVDAYVGWSTP